MGVEGRDILEDEELVWIEDSEWNESRVSAATERLKEQGIFQKKDL